MSEQPTSRVAFDDCMASLASAKSWQYDSGTKSSTRDIAGTVSAALQTPLDFPPVESAIVSGDRVALAVDPNVPQLCEVIVGVLKTIAHTEAEDIDIVLWDEASDETIESLKDIVGDSANLCRHDSTHRESLRYLGADVEGDPIYLNRSLVDADFVLPVIAARPGDAMGTHDLTGVFPMLADSATRTRHRSNATLEPTEVKQQNEAQIAWLLGVHLIVAITVNVQGDVGEVVAGAPNSIRKHLFPPQQSDQSPNLASLVVAVLDGDTQQQTWANAARALIAARRYVASGGAVVLWTALQQPPAGELARLADVDDIDALIDQSSNQVDTGDDGFPEWNNQNGVAWAIARAADEHRVLIHSSLSSETIEPMGLGCIDSIDELARLSKGFETCGVLRSAQFASSSVDLRHCLAPDHPETSQG